MKDTTSAKTQTAPINLELISQNLADSSLKHLSRPLALKSFEMLEAELQNQGILPPLADDQFSLSALAAQEATFWRWRQTRYGARRVSTSFMIDVPRYIIERARELDALPPEQQTSPWKFSFRTQSSIRSELDYLNKFAAYINGEYDNAENRYQQGLGVILKVLEQDTRPEAAALELILPLKKEEFLRKIAPYRSTN